MVIPSSDRCFRHIRVIGAEVLQDHHGLEAAVVGDDNALPGRRFADKKFIVAGLTEAQHNRCLGIVNAEPSVSLNDDAAVGGGMQC